MMSNPTAVSLCVQTWAQENYSLQIHTLQIHAVGKVEYFQGLSSDQDTLVLKSSRKDNNSI